MVTQKLLPVVYSTSNDDNASITYLGAFPNTNPIHEDLVQSGRADYVVANTLIDKLNAWMILDIECFCRADRNGTYVGGIYGTNNAFAQNLILEMHL